MIAEREIQMFKLLPSTISELADKLNIYPGSATKITEKLIKNGLAKKHRKGKKVFIIKEQTTHVQKLEEIIKTFPRLPLEEILTYTNLKILSLLNYQLKTSELQILINISRQWITKMINQLSSYGIILKKEGGLTINPIHQTLYEFAKYYQEYKNYQCISSILEDALIVWQHGDEILFKTKEELHDIPTTAVTNFQEYDIPLISNIKYYYKTNRNLNISDIILHTILIDIKSKTYNLYACLLIEKTIPSDLIKKARLYNLSTHIQNLILFLKIKNSNEIFLPTCEEYETLAKQYGVR